MKKIRHGEVTITLGEDWIIIVQDKCYGKESVKIPIEGNGWFYFTNEDGDEFQALGYTDDAGTGDRRINIIKAVDIGVLEYLDISDEEYREAAKVCRIAAELGRPE